MSDSMLIAKVPPLPVVLTLLRERNCPDVNWSILYWATLYSDVASLESVIVAEEEEELKSYAHLKNMFEFSPPKIVGLIFFKNLSLAGSPKESSGLVYWKR